MTTLSMQIMNMLGKYGGMFRDSGIRRKGNKVSEGARGISMYNLNRALTY